MAIRTRGDALQIDVQVTRDCEKLRHREKFVGSMADAKAREAGIKADLLAGRDPSASSPHGTPKARQRLTLGEALDNMTTLRWAKGGNSRQSRSAVKLAKDFFGADTPLAEITTQEIDRYVAHLMAKGRAPSTIGQRLNPISVACNYYHRRGQLDAVPVFEKPSAKGNERSRLLTDKEREEIVRLFEQDYDDVPGHVREGTPTGRDFADLFILLQDTGCRPSELRRCRPQDLHGDILAVLFTKTTNTRHLPLTQRAEEAWLRQVERREGENPFIWATEGRIRDCWVWIRQVMCKPRELDPEFVPYLMRHDCATRLYAMTRDLMLVRDWMGHTDIKMTLRYAKMFPAQLERARDMLQGGRPANLKVAS